MTGISHAYAQGTASEYRRELEADAAGHGISPEAIKGMKQPVLVRIMPQDQITQNIGDESNTTGVSGLSGSERAMNDARRINIDDMEFSESGEISETTVRQFVQSMPAAERNNLLDGSRPSRQAYDRAAENKNQDKSAKTKWKFKAAEAELELAKIALAELTGATAAVDPSDDSFAG